VGLVIPYLLRLSFGPAHRLLVPSCILGGGAYLVLCDLLEEHHYPGRLPKISETLWRIALWRDQWVALMSFSANHYSHSFDLLRDA
jgi:hypothetical protein